MDKVWRKKWTKLQGHEGQYQGVKDEEETKRRKTYEEIMAKNLPQIQETQKLPSRIHTCWLWQSKLLCYELPSEDTHGARNKRKLPANSQPETKAHSPSATKELNSATTVGAEGTHLGDRNVLSLDGSVDFIRAHTHGTVHLKWTHCTICKRYFIKVISKVL